MSARPYQSAARIAENPDYGRIVWHCERVTRGGGDRPGGNVPYDRLSQVERESCDGYAEGAQNYARGREAKVPLQVHLDAARGACVTHPRTCRGGEQLARDVHAFRWPD